MSYLSNLVHFIWSTASRIPSIKPEWEPRLHAYTGGILNNTKGKLLSAGGMEDHLHLFVSLSATPSLSDAASAIKSNSS